MGRLNVRDTTPSVGLAAWRSNRQVARMADQSSQFLAGTQTVQNPDYAAAQRNVTLAQTNYNTANLNRVSAGTGSCSGNTACAGSGGGRQARSRRRYEKGHQKAYREPA